MRRIKCVRAVTKEDRAMLLPACVRFVAVQVGMSRLSSLMIYIQNEALCATSHVAAATVKSTVEQWFIGLV